MKTKTVFTILIAVLILSPFQVCVAQPPIPHAFYGNLTVYGQGGAVGAPLGVVVEALVNGCVCGSFTTTEIWKYGGPNALDPKLIVQGYIDDNTLIYFYANGVRADQTWSFKSGDVTELDLTVDDNIAPVIGNLQPSWGEVVGTRTPTVAADYSDALSGVDITSVRIKIDGLDVTGDADVTESNVSYIPAMALADDTYMVEVSVKDRVGNQSTSTWSFTVYVPPPFAPPALATLTVDTTPIKASVYVNGVLWGIAPQTRSVDAGTYTVSFGDYLGYLTPSPQTVTLAAGETRTVIGVYTEIPTELIENQSPPVDIPSIAAGENETVEVENTFITELTICVKKDVENVRITVQQLTDKPAEIEIGAPGIAYCYLNIVAENITDADIESVTITFEVEKSWIAQNGIDMQTITLNRYDPVSGDWTFLPTTFLFEDDTYAYFSAVSPGLSVFAISGQVLQPDFTISVSPSSGSAVQGESVTATVSLTSVGGFSETVSLLASGLPSDATASFSPPSGTPSFTSALTISTSSATPTGTYTITITGTGGGLMRTATYTLTVTAAPAPIIVLLVLSIVIIVLAIVVLMWVWRTRWRARGAVRSSS